MREPYRRLSVALVVCAVAAAGAAFYFLLTAHTSMSTRRWAGCCSPWRPPLC